MADGTWIVLIWIPFKLKCETLGQINDLAWNIANDHKPHFFERLIEIHFWRRFHLDKVFVLLIFGDELFTGKYFVEFFDSIFLLHFIVSIGRKHDNRNENADRIHNQVRKFFYNKKITLAHLNVLNKRIDQY